MIDTGCQVTILATLVFERMCAADPGPAPAVPPVAGIGRLVSINCLPRFTV